MSGASVTNIASATADGVTSPDDSVTVPLQSPSITIAKTALPTVVSAVGDTITYSFLVTNSGNVTLNSVGVSDPLVGLPPISPRRRARTRCFDHLHCVVHGHPSEPQPRFDQQHRCRLGHPARWPAVTDTDTATVTATQSPSITHREDCAADHRVRSRSSRSYSFLVTNTGNVTLTSVGVTDPLVGLSAISCPGTVLAPAANMTCTANYAVTQADLNLGSISNTATGLGHPARWPAGHHTDTVNVPATTTPQLSIVKSTSATSYNAVGQVLNFTLTITNTGDVTLTNVVVSDASAAVGVCAATMPTTMAPGDVSVSSAAHAVTQNDIDHGSYDNVAMASGIPPGGQRLAVGSNAVTVPAAQNVAVAVVKATNATTFSSVGEQIVYTITATNVGNVTLIGVTISDPNAEIGLRTPIARTPLAPGGSLTCAAVHIVTQADLDAGRILDTARVDGDTGLIPLPVSRTR